MNKRNRLVDKDLNNEIFFGLMIQDVEHKEIKRTQDITILKFHLILLLSILSYNRY